MKLHTVPMVSGASRKRNRFSIGSFMPMRMPATIGPATEPKRPIAKAQPEPLARIEVG